MRSSHIKHITILLLLCPALSGCLVMERLSKIGSEPEFNDVKVYENIYDKPADNKAPIIPRQQQANSLWHPGSRGFFRDQRARSVGDILKVVVNIQDSAKLDNKTNLSRSGSASLGVPHLFGLEKEAQKILPSGFDPTNLASVNSKDTGNGQGKIDRKEAITTTVAAMVTQILPSNNLVIRGSQEIRVNYELREVTIEGVVRPEDISAENSVTLDQIAEARVSYGGRGNLSDRQQERYGKQALDILAPF